MGRKTDFKIPEGVGVEGLVKQREKAISVEWIAEANIGLTHCEEENWEESASEGHDWTQSVSMSI